MYRGALRSILSELVRQERLVVVEKMAVEAPKTKEMVARLKELGVESALVVADEVEQNLYLAARNIPHVDVRDVQGVDPVSLIAHEKVIMTTAAVKKFEEMLDEPRNVSIRFCLARTFREGYCSCRHARPVRFQGWLPLLPSWK